MSNPVVTITLNPAVDKSSSVKGIVPDKKLRCDPPKFEPGGGGINVSRALKRLGVPSTSFFTSGGKTGTLLEELLKAEGIETQPFSIRAETRENFIVVDSGSNQQFRFGFPGPEMSESEQNKMLNAVAGFDELAEFVVISGSLLPGLKTGFFKNLIQKFKAGGKKVIVDTSGDALREAVEEGVFLIKPNLGELAKLSGMEELDDTFVDSAAAKIISEGKATIVVVSLGALGAELYTHDKKIRVPAPVVRKRSTVGAGDSMVAGMVSILAKGGSMDEMLRMGIACGSATTMAEGTGLFLKENVDRLYQYLESKS